MMADVYKPHISGVTNYIATNKRYLERLGHEVFVFTFGNLDYADDEIRIIRSAGLPLVDSGYYFSFRYSPAAKALLQTMDIVHIHHPFLSGRLALRYCRPLRIPIIFTNHTRYDLYIQAYIPILPEGLGETFLQAYLPSFCRSVDLVISPSSGMEKVLRRLNVDAPVDIVPNGVELDRFRGPRKPRHREEFGFSQQDIVLVYAGRLAVEKNLHFLLSSFAGIARTYPQAKLLVVGDGPIKDALIARTRLEGLSDRVCFTGLVSYEEIPDYLAACDVFLTASISEVHPLSVIEAMASGLPILGIQSPGVGDTVEDSKTGLLSEDNLAEFTAKMARMITEDGLRSEMGQAARLEAEKFAIERTTRMMADRYQELSERASDRHRSLNYLLRSQLEKWRR